LKFIYLLFLDAILEKYEPKDKDATTNTNDPTPPHGH
jgi:hypothetical protein